MITKITGYSFFYCLYLGKGNKKKRESENMSDFGCFIECMRVKFRPWRVFALGIMSSLFLVGVIGCQKETKIERQPSKSKEEIQPAATNRLQDAAYMGALKEAASSQISLIGARNQIGSKLKACEGRIRKSLPKDATKEQIQSALQKDQEWKRLNADLSVKNEQLKELAQKNKDLVTGRIRAEQKAIKDLKKQK